MEHVFLLLKDLKGKMLKIILRSTPSTLYRIVPLQIIPHILMEEPYISKIFVIFQIKLKLKIYSSFDKLNYFLW